MSVFVFVFVFLYAGVSVVLRGPCVSPRYFKQDSAAELAARDKLVKGYIKLKLNTSDGLPLDDEEDPDTVAGEMTLEKVDPQ